MKKKLMFCIILLLSFATNLKAEKYLSLFVPVTQGINFNEVKIGDQYIIHWPNSNIN